MPHHNITELNIARLPSIPNFPFCFLGNGRIYFIKTEDCNSVKVAQPLKPPHMPTGTRVIQTAQEEGKCIPQS